MLYIGALAAQRIKYEEQLSKLKEQLESSNVSSPIPPKLKYTTLVTSPWSYTLILSPAPFSIEEEWEEKNRGRLIKSVLHANRLVQEANLLAEALHKDTVFKVTLTVPRSFLSPTSDVTSENTHNEVAIRVLHKQRGTDSVWTTDTLEEKVLTMREMYEHMEEGGSLLVSDSSPSPYPPTTRVRGVDDLFSSRMNLLALIHSMTWSNMHYWVWLTFIWSVWLTMSFMIMWPL